ncbi:MAG TPA: SDR family oxidoreductase [Acidobacteriota bacterium]|nr:SDR family oxidoreductase [Acidobacteriota bacterium]HJO28925.1 SDR family oxidoreductase [Acidobacteriota bacterium]
MQPVALVTGGGVRVGRAIAWALASSGYRMVVNYHTSTTATQTLVDQIREVGGDCISVQADVADRPQVDRLLDVTLEKYGGIDVLVNNAAIFDERPFLEVDDDLWQRTLAVNLTGSFNVAQATARVMERGRRGHIINICGTAGISPIGDYAPYCVAKAGVDMLTRCMAEALAPHIQVNGVAPGTVLFPEGTTQEEQRRVIDRIPGGAIGRPEDIAEAVCFLAGAPTYMTGTIIAVDGGAGLGVA